MHSPEKGNIYSILDGKKQFIIPVYQRTYSWEKNQCEKLWNDIVNMQKNNKLYHFMGSVVNISEQNNPTGINVFMIIDGQQRMTTLTLLLLALRDYANENPNCGINPLEIEDTYIKNKYGDGDGRYKLILTQNDRECLISIIEKRYNINENSRIVYNYKYFKEMISKKILVPEEIYEAVGKLQIISITLERDKDDAQEIFESLNSTGKELLQSDLIRNNILMRLSDNDQKDIYENLWHPMEELFIVDNKEEIMDRFFRDYLTMENTQIPNINHVYDEFKEYKKKFKEEVDYTLEKQNNIDLKDKSNEYILVYLLCKRIYRYAKIYTDMVFIKQNNETLLSLYKDINSLKMNVVYPFLLYVHGCYEDGDINIDVLIEIIKICINYVFRRAICNMATNSHNKTFATLKNKIKKEDYINSIKAFFIMCEDYREYPSDEKFAKDFKSIDLYNKEVKKYCLEKLENYNNKSSIIIDKLTIEHIMPQNENLCDEWRKMLGANWKDIQKKYLHTIGNLTLTAYNSELSDKQFIEKRDMEGGFKESALRINKDLVDLEEWNENTIINRAERLTCIALDIWKYPELNDLIIDKYKENNKKDIVYSLDDYDLNEFNKILFDKLDKNILNLSTSIKREYKKKYIAYKLDTNFVDLVFQTNKLRLAVNMKYNEINDPYRICKDITNVGRWGNGDVELFFEHLDEIDKVMYIIKQFFDKRMK